MLHMKTESVFQNVENGWTPQIGTSIRNQLTKWITQ